MSRRFKLSIIAICALALSGCALTNGVAQNVYDNKAEKECYRSSASGHSSVDTSQSVGCINGIYVPNHKSKDSDKKSDKKTEKASFPTPY